MNQNGHKLTRQTWERFMRAVRRFRASSAGKRGLGWFGFLVALMCAINGLNVLNSYVGRDFISAIEHRDHLLFVKQAWIYAGVFGLSTLVTVFLRFSEERLALLWRDWQTRELLGVYLDNRSYYQIEESGVIENPDQRIAEDIRTFTTTTLSFVLMMMNGSFTVIAFSGVLWSISPQLFIVAVAYASLGTALTVWLGKSLIGLNNQQLDKEANFRSELIHVREHAESVALLHREARLKTRLLDRLDNLVSNMRHMIAVNRNLGFFTTGYNYLIQLLPALVVAPFFIKGNIEFGVITQSAMAFAQLMGAFSLIVTQFQSISSYAAVIGRLGKMIEAMDHPCDESKSKVETYDADKRIVFDHLTLKRSDGSVLIKDLCATIEHGTRVLVVSTSGHAKVGLFRATAGLCCDGEGRIGRPDADQMLFLPERPYLPKGTLRELLVRSALNGSVPDEEVLAVLGKLNAESIVTQAGGLRVEQDWNALLGISEQAALAVARALLANPQFVFFDRLSIAMDNTQADQVLKLFTEQGISYLVLGKPNDSLGNFDAALQIATDGTWSWQTVTP